MLQDTLQVLEQGYYEKNGKKIKLKLSQKEMEEIRVYLPDEVKSNANQKSFNPPLVYLQSLLNVIKKKRAVTFNCE